MAPRRLWSAFCLGGLQDQYRMFWRPLLGRPGCSAAAGASSSAFQRHQAAEEVLRRLEAPADHGVAADRVQLSQDQPLLVAERLEFKLRHLPYKPR